MNYEEEEKYLHSLSDELDNVHGRQWAKYKGDLINRKITAFLRNHLTEHLVSEPNAFIVGDSTEFDILILDKNARPKVPDSNIYQESDVKTKIEVKKHGFFYKKVEGKEKIEKYFEPHINAKIPFYYITVKENVNFTEDTRSALGNKCFFLGTSHKQDWNTGEWKRFVEAIKNTRD
jgi:hypothetical protein